MEDERIVPVPVSVYKAEVWRHLGFCGNVRPRTVARVPPRFCRLPHPVWRARWLLGAFCAVGVVFAFTLGIQQALYFSLILYRCHFLFRSKCYDIVCHKCKLKLWTFKAGSKIYIWSFYKIHFIHIHLTKESCRHLNFSPFTRTAQKVVQ